MLSEAPGRAGPSRAGHATLGRDELAARLARSAPDNEHRSRGYALVCVVDPEHFERERIPGSTNIPVGEAQRFDERFDTGKEIIVYGASPRCTASERAARELSRRGFDRVVHYRGGLAEWRDADHPLSGTGS